MSHRAVIPRQLENMRPAQHRMPLRNSMPARPDLPWIRRTSASRSPSRCACRKPCQPSVWRADRGIGPKDNRSRRIAVFRAQPSSQTKATALNRLQSFDRSHAPRSPSGELNSAVEETGGIDCPSPNVSAVRIGAAAQPAKAVATTAANKAFMRTDFRRRNCPNRDQTAATDKAKRKKPEKKDWYGTDQASIQQAVFHRIYVALAAGSRFRLTAWLEFSIYQYSFLARR